MEKLKALIDFDDFQGKEIDYIKNKHIKRKANDIFEATIDRAELLISRGFAEVAEKTTESVEISAEEIKEMEDLVVEAKKEVEKSKRKRKSKEG